jgi:hypothetical protein
VVWCEHPVGIPGLSMHPLAASYRVRGALYGAFERGRSAHIASNGPCACCREVWGLGRGKGGALMILMLYLFTALER